MRTVAIDGDLLVYRNGFAGQSGTGDDIEYEPLENILHSVKTTINSIISNTRAENHVLFLTGKDNFRDEVATIQGYKENRRGKPKPFWYDEIREYMINVQEAIVIDGEEADDALGIFLTTAGSDGICASYDKDLLTIPGEHYNWVKGETVFVTEEEALRFFYTQLLTGDSVDNIPGIYKMTGTKASKKIKEGLDGLDDKASMWDYVFSCYCTAYDNVGLALNDRDEVVTKWLTEIGQLLYIRKYEGEVWAPPTKETI